jgi:GTP-binding protein
VDSWEKEFLFVNQAPEENSDFDSDNEVNPLDTLDSLGRYTSKHAVTSDNKHKKKPIQLTIIGRPNVGKSTLVNQLLQEHRVIANDLAGTTRDAVRIQWIYAGRRVTLVDTAGIKSGSRAGQDKVDLLLEEEVRRAVQYSHVVAVVIDSMQGFSASEMALIKRVVDEGRGVVVVANKWDLVEDRFKKKAIKWMEKQLEKGLGQAKGIPIAYVSAKSGQRTERIMDEVLRVYEKWNTRVSTGLLNKWLHAFTTVQKMPSDQGKMLKLRYLMQIKTRPPTFFLFANNKRLIEANFEAFVRNSISKEFGFQGVPVRILLRDSRT